MADLLPPHSFDAEEAVLGSILIDHEALLRVASFLQPEHFYVVKHQWVFDAMQRLQPDGSRKSAAWGFSRSSPTPSPPR